MNGEGKWGPCMMTWRKEKYPRNRRGLLPVGRPAEVTVLFSTAKKYLPPALYSYSFRKILYLGFFSNFLYLKSLD